MSLRRALHFVLKDGKRNASAKFYREILGMKVSFCFLRFPKKIFVFRIPLGLLL